MKRVVFVLFILGFISDFINAQNNKVYKENTPSWVTVQNINLHNNKLDQHSEDGYVDLNYENQISLEHQTFYTKAMMKIISDAGVQNNSEITINFDPVYQKLIFHTIRIIRGKESIDQLELKKFKVIQQEKELDKHLYDGSLTALLMLEDVRKGDIIEYSYSLKGFNPIYNNRFATALDLQFSVPVYNLYYKIIIPKNRNLLFKNNRSELQPVISDTGIDKIYEWNLKDVNALQVEEEIPSWYDAYPTVMISEFQSWKEVAEWASGLFTFPVTLTPALEQKIKEIKNKYASAGSRTVAALQFVQDEIRYMGIEMGVNSYKPNSPGAVMKQRFGDCKDKSYLLCVMLHEMGIDADPVMINTSFKKTIKERLPSPKIFDHVTVRAKINGKFYWFDPTVSYQRGKIDDISFPDYQCGLIISENTTALTEIAVQDKGRVDVRETFNIRDAYSPVSFIVRTTNTGSWADDIRDDFENNSRQEMLKKYREYYSAYFDNIVADSIRWTDDPESGSFTTTEYYTISDFWETEGKTKKILFQPYVIDALVTKPDDAKRSMPYRLIEGKYKEEIVVNLPEEWDISSYSDRISNTSFLFTCDYTSSGRQVILKYEYQRLEDHVSPRNLSDYISNYKKVMQSSGYELTWEENSVGYSGPNRDVAISFDPYRLLYTLLVLAALVTFMIRRTRKQTEY
jgi:hypothetical protein